VNNTWLNLSMVCIDEGVQEDNVVQHQLLLALCHARGDA